MLGIRTGNSGERGLQTLRSVCRLSVRARAHRSAHSDECGRRLVARDHDAQDAVVPEQRGRAEPGRFECRVTMRARRIFVAELRFMVLINLNIRWIP